MTRAVYDVVIIGAGPAGLACAQVTASHGLKTLVVERKNVTGQKVCAGGITWNGLIGKLKDISERSFPTQYIFSKNQSFKIAEKNPIIATVNREALGALMCQNARNAGAEILMNSQVVAISSDAVTVRSRDGQLNTKIGYKYLVGADGSSSSVRKYLGIPVNDFGVGINFMVEGNFSNMEWHLNSTLFGSGYSWIFPHSRYASVGAYSDAKSISAGQLKNSLIKWANMRHIKLPLDSLKAERINYDYQGYKFANIYLAGDAAGLASALTGEGIYPAMISGEAVGCEISSQTSSSAEAEFATLLKNHKRHRLVAKIVRIHPAVSTLLSELICCGLRSKIINFRAAEMAH